MILELAVLDVRPGEAARFEDAFEQAKSIVASSPGFRGLRLERCVEHPSRYALLIEWDTLEDHTEGFRGSPAYERWRELLHHFYEPFPVVEHYEPVVRVDGMVGDDDTSDRAFPIITVRDLPATRRFYEQLGFIQTYQFPPEGEPGFVTVARGASSIGIGAGGDDIPDRFGYWVYVDDVDATFDALRASGAPVVAEPADQPWGERVARTRDPAGNLVYLGAPT
jgi:lactoylglutathione lyase